MQLQPQRAQGPGLERRAGRCPGGRRRLHRPPQPERHLLGDGRLHQRRAQGSEQAGTNTCGWTAATAVGWQHCPAGEPATAGQFHYDVDTSRHLDSQGVVRVTSTGKVQRRHAARSRSSSPGRVDRLPLLHRLRGRRPGEHQAPYPSRRATQRLRQGSGPTRRKYFWQSAARGLRRDHVQSLGDVLDGKVHFNDTPLMTRQRTRPSSSRATRPSDPNCSVLAHRRRTTAVNCKAVPARTPNLNGYVRREWTPRRSDLPDNSSRVRDLPRLRVHRRHPDQVQVRRHHGRLEHRAWHDGRRARTRRRHQLRHRAPSARRGADRPAGQAERAGPQRHGHLRQERPGTHRGCVPGQIVNGTASGSTSTTSSRRAG